MDVTRAAPAAARASPPRPASVQTLSDDEPPPDAGSVRTLSDDEPPPDAAWRARHAALLAGLQTLAVGDPFRPGDSADALALDSASASDSADSASCSSGAYPAAPGGDVDDDDDGELDDGHHDDDDDDADAGPLCDGHLMRTRYTRVAASADGVALPPSPKQRRARSASSSAVLTTLKKRWKGVKKASVKSTASAGKSLSSLSASYFAATPTETKEDRQSRLGDEWLTILPSWRKKRRTARVRTLVFRGVPASVRGRVWQAAIGNSLNVSEQLFDVLKERAYTGRMEYMRGRETLALADGDVGGIGGQAEEMLESERSAHKAIMLDLPRTFPDLTFFHAEGSHYEFALRDVLEAFLYLKPDVGYSQGMSFLAAVLLLYMDPFEAFSCFVNMLLHKSCFLHFFRIKMPEVRIYLTVHDRLLAEEMPALHSHFRQHGIESDLYMINWVMSLYCRALPLDLVARIWDVYVLDGDVAIFRAALGILRLYQARLVKMKFEDMAYFLSHLPQDVNHDSVMHSIRSVRIVTKKRFRDLFKEIQACHDRGGERLEEPQKTPATGRKSYVS